MTLWWGEAWPRPDYRAPICENDSEHIATPVGEECFSCQETIVEGDQGTALMAIEGGYDGKPMTSRTVYQHRECGLRGVMGCYGHLTGGEHTCWPHDVSYREDARRVQDWVQRHGTLSL